MGICCTVGGFLVAPGCAFDQQLHNDSNRSASEDTVTGEETIAGDSFRDGVYPAEPMPLKICTSEENPSGWQLPGEYDTLRTWVFQTLASTWGRVPGIAFDDVGECTTLTPDQYHLNLTLSPGDAGGCSRGASSCGIAGHVNNENRFRFVVVHEIGHRLGFPHEHQRADDPQCDWIKAALATDPNNGQLRQVSDLVLLTPAETYSVMNYCGDSLRAAKNWDYQPTAWDLLGAEMFYPMDRVYPVGCRANCVYTSNGVVVRSDGAITSSWTARGGLNVVMRWGTLEGESIAADALPNGPSNVDYTFVDPRGARWNGSGMVTKSDSLHAAIVTGITQSLL
jgi:hypothetical protein